MYDWQFFGTFDLARISLWAFWLFFGGLVIWIQRENQREGYPLENDTGSPAGSLFSTPEPKTFILPGGRGTVQAPGPNKERTDLALARTNAGEGFPFEPTGDAMDDGVGPASWAVREDAPELDAHGHAKIMPMASAHGIAVAAGRNPLGRKVIGNDRQVAGTITELWVDVPEQLVRYLEVTLADKSKRLIPMPMARIKTDGVRINSISSARFAGIPKTAKADRVTKLEEEKICAYFAGGTMYDQGNKVTMMQAIDTL